MGRSNKWIMEVITYRNEAIYMHIIIQFSLALELLQTLTYSSELFCDQHNASQFSWKMFKTFKSSRLSHLITASWSSHWQSKWEPLGQVVKPLDGCLHTFLENLLMITQANKLYSLIDIARISAEWKRVNIVQTRSLNAFHSTAQSSS